MKLHLILAVALSAALRNRMVPRFLRRMEKIGKRGNDLQRFPLCASFRNTSA